MDVKHKDMQYLGTFEIFKESFKIINKNRKIVALAALCFVHPQNFILSGFLGTLNLLIRNFHEYGNISHLFSHNWPFFWHFNVFYIISLFGSSMLSTAGVSHTVAAVYTGRVPDHNETMSVIAKVWKRVFVTFFCSLLVLLAYHVIAGFALFLIVWTSIMKHGPFGKVEGTILGVFLVLYFVGLLYLVVVLQLAGVVSALEESCGFKAMEKSMLLLKGRMVSATVVVLAIWLRFGIILWLDALVRKMLLSPSMIIWMYVLVNLLFQFFILVFLLWELVLETMLYFVCKSYHHESIDMLALSNHDQIPLRSLEC